MKTTKQASTSRKGAKNETKKAAPAAASVNAAVNAAAASVAAGVATSHESAVAVAAGVATPAAVPAGRASAVAAMMDESNGLKELRAKICAAFAVPEWSGAASLRAALLPLVETGVMDVVQYDAALRAAALKAGVSAPLCTLPRVLAVARRFASDFGTACGCEFEDLRKYFAAGGRLSTYALALPLGSVRANSKESDYICASVCGDTPAAIVAAVLSVRFVVSFRRTVAAAKGRSRVEMRGALCNVWREAQRLGLSYDDVAAELREIACYVDDTDTRQRNQLERNLAAAWRNYNAVNDSILQAGGAEGVHPAKVAKLLAKRARYASVAATCEALLK